MKNTALLLPCVVLSLLCLVNPAQAASGSSFTINNGSTVNSGQSLGSSSGQTGTVNAGGILNVTGTSNSSSNAITLVGTATINNSGLIEQTTTTISGTQGARAIRDNTGGFLITITNSGTITAAGNDAIQAGVANSNFIVTNSGTIAALGTGNFNGQAIDWNKITTGTNTLHNNAGGTITAADADAIRPGVNGTITNDGFIKGYTIGDSGNDGIDAQTNSGVTIINANSNLSTNANLIEGASHAITGGLLTGATYTMSVTNNSNGIIKGDDGSGLNIDGVNGNEVVTVVNHGLISGHGATGDGDGVDVDGLVNITNTGTIVSLNSVNDTSEGVTVGGGTIINSGTIEGSVTLNGTNTTAVGRGITLAGVDKDANDNPIPIQKIYANTTIVNSGLIKGDTDAGIGILGYNTTVTATYTAISYSVTITNTLGGTIEGNSSTVAAIDGSANIGNVGTASSNNETIINYGTIKQDGSGKAISLGSGANSVQIVGPSASVIGDMSGGTISGTNSLTIDPTLGGSFTYGGVISNFGSVEIKSGTVTFSGLNTYNGTTTIDAATLDLTGTGTIGTTTTLTINSGGTFDLGGGTVNVGTLVNSGTINHGTVNAGTIGGLTGSGFTKTGSDTLVLSGTNTYTGGTTVSQGKLAVNGSVTGNVAVQTGAEVGGHGTIGGIITGSGSVGPGNSPGILTASATDPTGGLSYNFEFTQVGAPTWSNASASGNDVLHLTAALPFTAPLTSANDINVYFSGLSLTYEGGFFTNGSTDDLSSNTANATYTYYLLDNAHGTYAYNGNMYDLITAPVIKTTQFITGANFGDGTVNGWTIQFTSPGSVPEPSTYVLIGLGLAGVMIAARRRGLKRD